MKTIKLILGGLITIAIFVCLFLFNIFGRNIFIPVILKAQSQWKLQFENEEFDFPLYVYIAEYDPQKDKILINEKTCFYINDHNFNLNELNREHYRYNAIEYDSYLNYGDDALPCFFYIFASDKIDVDKDGFANVIKPTISYVRAMKNVLSVPIPKMELGGTIKYGQLTFKEENIKDNIAPVIEGHNGYITTDVTSPITTEEIKSLLTAKDKIDGDLTNKIIIEENNYEENMFKIGTYDILFSVTDNSGNKTTLKIYIDVLDITSPIITGPNQLITYISNPLNLDDIKQNYTVNDEYDGDVTKNIEIIGSTYETADKTKTGTYEIIIKANDNSNNITTKKIKISILDDIKPLISGDSIYTKSHDAILTIDDIMKNLYANDNIEGEITNKIYVVEDNYTMYSSQLGTYTILFKVNDNSKNISNTFVVTINVKDLSSPIFYVDETVISIHSFDELKKEKIENYLIKKSKINLNYKYNLEIIEDEYSQSNKKPGVYKCKVLIEYENAIKEEILLSIFVNDNHNDYTYQSLSSNNFISFLSNIWNSISSFFLSCWNFILSYIINPIFSIFN